MNEIERLMVEALTRYDDAISLCAASGPTTEEWESIKDAWRQGLAALETSGHLTYETETT